MNNIVKLTFIVQKYIYLYLYTHTNDNHLSVVK